MKPTVYLTLAIVALVIVSIVTLRQCATKATDLEACHDRLATVVQADGQRCEVVLDAERSRCQRRLDDVVAAQEEKEVRQEHEKQLHSNPAFLVDTFRWLLGYRDQPVYEPGPGGG